MATGLRALGVEVTETPDGAVIEGGRISGAGSKATVITGLPCPSRWRARLLTGRSL